MSIEPEFEKVVSAAAQPNMPYATKHSAPLELQQSSRSLFYKQLVPLGLTIC
jgi:hypothetical protein